MIINAIIITKGLKSFYYWWRRSSCKGWPTPRWRAIELLFPNRFVAEPQFHRRREPQF